MNKWTAIQNSTDKFITYFILVENFKILHTNVKLHTFLVMNTWIFKIGVGGERERFREREESNWDRQHLHLK